MRFVLRESTSLDKDGGGRTLKDLGVVAEGIGLEEFIDRLKREGWRILYAPPAWVLAEFEHANGRVMRLYEAL